MADSDLIAKAMLQIEDLTGKLVKLKMFVNQADILNGDAPRFEDLTDDELIPMARKQPSGPIKWTPGTFYNKPFAAAVKMILQRLYDVNNQPTPAAVDYIHICLTEGSFAFPSNDAEGQKNSIRISLGKNSTTFVKLPGTDLFGLAEWYGARTRKTARKSAGAGSSSAEGGGEEADGDVGDAEADNPPSEPADTGQEAR